MKTADHMAVMVLPGESSLQVQVQVRVDLEALALQFAMKAHRAKGKKRTLAAGAIQVEVVAYPSMPKRG